MAEGWNVEDFVREESIKVTLKRGVKTPYAKLDKWQQAANKYTATLRRKSRKGGTKQLTTEFFTGSGWTEDPSAADILDSCVSDARSAEGASSMEDFATDFGYEWSPEDKMDYDEGYVVEGNPYASAVKIWKGVNQMKKKLQRFFADDPDMYNELLYDIESM